MEVKYIDSDMAKKIVSAGYIKGNHRYIRLDNARLNFDKEYLIVKITRSRVKLASKNGRDWEYFYGRIRKDCNGDLRLNTEGGLFGKRLT